MKTLSHAQMRKVQTYLPDEDGITDLIRDQQRWIRATSERETQALVLLRKMRDNPNEPWLSSKVDALLERKAQ